MSIDKTIRELNENRNCEEYHRLVFDVYERGYNFTNHWHMINTVKTSTEFYNSIRWSIDVELHEDAVKLIEKVLNANRWKKSSVIELHEKDSIHYFKKEYKLKVRLLKHLRKGNLDTFCNTHQHYVDVLHPMFPR
jgi:hypothetical protein